ncbi:MAG: hypothetical protein LBP86_02610 [Azoarcus sp.]|jgi:hypothetical protein|nr:hypothetical protein [Azoarcus sp.]
MKIEHFLYVLALLSSTASARDPFSCDNHFGEDVQIVTEQIELGIGSTLENMRLEKGDLNGDGLKDKVVVLRLNKITKLDDDVTLLNPPAILPTNRKKQSVQISNAPLPTFPPDDATALGIIQSNISDKKCRKFVIYNTDFFPVKTDHFSVRVIRAGDESYGYTLLQKSVTEDLRYDAIYMSGVFMTFTTIGLVYWSNGKYIFDLPFDSTVEGDETDE